MNAALEFSLTPAEATEFQACEQSIERGLETFIEVGLALTAIRQKRLYRASFDTFEAYCAQRWEMRARRAYQLCDAAEAVANLNQGSQFLFLPASERQVRPLVGLPPEEQRAAWSEAVATAPAGRVTSKHVAEVVQARRVRLGLEPAAERDRRDGAGLESGALNQTSSQVSLSPASLNDPPFINGDRPPGPGIQPDQVSGPGIPPIRHSENGGAYGAPPLPDRAGRGDAGTAADTVQMNSSSTNGFHFSISAPAALEKEKTQAFALIDETAKASLTRPAPAPFPPCDKSQSDIAHDKPKSAKLALAQETLASAYQLMETLGTPNSVAHDLTSVIHKLEAIKGWLEDISAEEVK